MIQIGATTNSGNAYNANPLSLEALGVGGTNGFASINDQSSQAAALYASNADLCANSGGNSTGNNITQGFNAQQVANISNSDFSNFNPAALASLQAAIQGAQTTGTDFCGSQTTNFCAPIMTTAANNVGYVPNSVNTGICLTNGIMAGNQCGTAMVGLNKQSSFVPMNGGILTIIYFKHVS